MDRRRQRQKGQKCIESERDRFIERETDKQTNRQTDRQADRQRQTDMQTDRQRCRRDDVTGRDTDEGDRERYC